MISFWRGIFKFPKVEDQRRPNIQHLVLQEVIAPVAVAEASTLLQELLASAPGLDGIINSNFKRRDPRDIATLLNAVFYIRNALTHIPGEDTQENTVQFRLTLLIAASTNTYPYIITKKHSEKWMDQ